MNNIFYVGIAVLTFLFKEHVFFADYSQIIQSQITN